MANHNALGELPRGNEAPKGLGWLATHVGELGISPEAVLAGLQAAGVTDEHDGVKYPIPFTVE